MTITYDPQHVLYFDEADVRDELTRVFDVCQGCRRCVELCSSFPTLFEMIERRAGGSGTGTSDAGLLTPAEQDLVVDQCFQCKVCAVGCPYTPERHEARLDFPRLMLRATAMQHEHGISAVRSRATAQVVGRVDLVGKLATSTFPLGGSLVNKVVTAEPHSFVRRIAALVTGISAERLLVPFAAERFTTWFKQRPKVRLVSRQGRVTVFPTCVVDYQRTDIGKDLVKVFERNGIECASTSAGCCGAPWLHAGDVEQFRKVAERNVTALAKEVRAGTDVVVPQPACSYVLKFDYPAYVTDPALWVDAELVAEHTFDSAEYLMNIHRADQTVLDIDFDGPTVKRITYHAPAQLRLQNLGFPSRDLMQLTGARVTTILQGAGVEGQWGVRSANDEGARLAAEKLGERIRKAGGDLVAGDCLPAHPVIAAQVGNVPVHPLQVVARAYGISPEQ